MLKSKTIKIFIALLVIISVLVVPVSAAQSSDNTFIMACGTPSVSNYTGYIEVLLKDKQTKLHSVRTFMWSVYEWGLMKGEESNAINFNDVNVNVVITDGDANGYCQLEFRISQMSGVTSVLYGNIFSIHSKAKSGVSAVIEGSFSYDNGPDENYKYRTTSEVVAYHVSPNTTVDSYSNYISHKEFYVLYAESGAVYNAITNGQQDQTDQIIQGQEQQTEDIKDNQDRNTQAIIDNQKEMQENEKTEANDSGGGGVGSLDSAIPNKSEGFISSIGNLVSAMSYSGTNCDLPIPTVKIPEIKGVIKETVLMDNMSVPFGFWISKIPSGIMLLVQSVLTIALVVFCFKELYSVISYVLTLRGGGASE